jgi:GntR family trehalose operon transcriptional repressor
LAKRSSTTVHEFGLTHPDAYIQSSFALLEMKRYGGSSDRGILTESASSWIKTILSASMTPLLTKEICEDSIYQYLEGECGLVISYAHKEIVVEPCTAEDQEYLDLNGYEHIVVVKNFVFLDDTTLFQYTESRHRLDKFRFVDFARREK